MSTGRCSASLMGPDSKWKWREGKDSTDSGQPWGSIPQTWEPQGKQDTLCFKTRMDWALLSGFANFRALEMGSATSSSFSLAPQCSLHLILQKHQPIRNEVCPEIAIWMNITFVIQWWITAYSHGPYSQAMHAL